MNVWVAGSTRNDDEPSMFARSTPTVPSSGPGMSQDPMGFMLRLPVMMPRLNLTGGSWLAMPSGVVPSRDPAGPRNDRSRSESANASTISLPWLGGLSITTRPSCGSDRSER